MSNSTRRRIRCRRVMRVTLGLSMATVAGCGDAEVASELPPALAATVDLTIGELEGDEVYVFGRITGLAGDSAGRVYVADAQADEIRMYDVEGTFLRRVARRGSGPGEVQSPCCLALDESGRLCRLDA